MKPQRAALAWLAGISILLAGAATFAAEPNLDELQRQLDAAKKAQEKKKREADQPPKPAVPPPTEALTSPDAAKSVASSFVAQGDDVLRNTVTGLVWTRSDNGRNVSADDAKAHCQKSPGWQLPTRDELADLYDSKLSGVACGEDTCKVSTLFRLTGALFWSNRADGFSLGGLYANSSVLYVRVARVLCVRRS